MELEYIYIYILIKTITCFHAIYFSEDKEKFLLVEEIETIN